MPSSVDIYVYGADILTADKVRYVSKVTVILITNQMMLTCVTGAIVFLGYGNYTTVCSS